VANIRNSNTYWVDTGSQSLVVEKNTRLLGVILTASGGAAVLNLADDVVGASYPSKIEVAAASGTTTHLVLDQAPIVFPNGIRVVTATNCRATLILAVGGRA
jgi:hypothetical protein